MGRPSREQSRDVRALLLEETVRVITEGGEQSVRTRAVAAAVGVTEPALFHYFGSREGLIEEAQARRFETTQVDLMVKFRRTAMRCTTKDEFAKVVIATLEASFSRTRMPNREARINITGSAVSRPRLRARLVEAQHRALAPLVDTMDYARDQGWVRPEFDSEAFGYWISALISGRYYAELDPEPRLLRRLNSMIIRSTLIEIGFDPKVYLKD